MKIWLALICSAMISVHAGSPAGHLILNGGGKKPASVMQKFVELSGGRDALILIVPTASELADTGDYYRDLFAGDYGCTNVTPLTLKTREDAASGETVALIEKAGGIFFSGGDQRRIVEVILDTPVGKAVASAYMRGAALGGTSAGTACMSSIMLTGDGEFDRITADNIVTVRGLGFFPNVILDQHFLARQRQNRLISVVLENPGFLGVGVDEATAVWRKPDGSCQVVGEGLVQLYDATDAGPAKGKNGLLTAAGMRVHLLAHGQSFKFENGKLTLNPEAN